MGRYILSSHVNKTIDIIYFIWIRVYLHLYFCENLSFTGQNCWTNRADGGGSDQGRPSSGEPGNIVSNQKG